MGHCCKCGFREHFFKIRAKNLGVLGVVLFALHLLWHVFECLLLPALFLGASHFSHELSEPEASLSISAKFVEMPDLQTFSLDKTILSYKDYDF